MRLAPGENSTRQQNEDRNEKCQRMECFHEASIITPVWEPPLFEKCSKLAGALTACDDAGCVATPASPCPASSDRHGHTQERCRNGRGTLARTGVVFIEQYLQLPL